MVDKLTLPSDVSPEALHVQPTPEEAAEAQAKDRAGRQKWMRMAVEALAVVALLALAASPLATYGVVPIDASGRVLLVVAAGLMLSVAAVLHPLAGYRTKAPVEQLGAIRRRDEAILNALSVATTVVLALILIVELVALLVLVGVVRNDSPTIVTAASYFGMFSTFTLLFLDLLLVARTAFHTRYQGKPWHATFAYILLTFGFLVFAVAYLKSRGLLASGVLGSIAPEQST